MNLRDLDPGRKKGLITAPVLGMYVLPNIFIVGAIFKNTALREKCTVETIWMVFMNPVQASI